MIIGNWFQGRYSNGSYDNSDLYISSSMIRINNVVTSVTRAFNTFPIVLKRWRRIDASSDWYENGEVESRQSTASIYFFDKDRNMVGGGLNIDAGETMTITNKELAIYVLVTVAVGADVVNRNIHPKDADPPADYPSNTYYQIDTDLEYTFTEETWSIGEDGFPHSNFAELFPKDMTIPIPKAMWRIAQYYNNGFPFNELLPNIPYNPPPPTPTVDPLEFYDEYNAEYLDGLRQKHRHYKLRVELLGYYENVIGEITKDVSLEASGQITINNEQITRRSCVLNLINVEKQYLPSPDNPIWFNRKFKLWIGIAIKDKTYWWSQGVYFTQKATSDGNVVNIQGIDKGGALDGTIKTGMLDTTYIIEANTTIANVIRDTLMWNETNSPYLRRNTRATSYPIDPITPIISSRFDTYRTQNEITLNGNDYVSTLFSSLADGYGADAYYNTNGRFVFQLMADSNRIDGYRFMAHQWDFGTFDEFYADANVEYNFDGYNVVTVYTNESDLENVSYTAANNNPLSPLRLDSAGVRRMSDVEIPYVNVSQDEMESRCKAYADYLLMKESMRGMAITFSSPIIPHLDVNRTIGITDDRFNLNTDTFVINSITIPLSAESMQINATKISWLPDNTSIEGEN